MRSPALLLVSAFLLLATSGSDSLYAQSRLDPADTIDPMYRGRLLMSAWLTGDQEVPAVATSATGVAGFALKIYRDTLLMRVSAHGLSGPITGMQIREGDSGISGPAVIDLTSIVSGNGATGIISKANLLPGQLAKFLTGRYYINISTTAHPDGEIRGQIGLESNVAFQSTMTSDQVVPSFNSTARGLAGFELAQDRKTLRVQAVLDNVAGTVTGAFLHRGTPGQNGPMVADLSRFISGNVINGTSDTIASFLRDLDTGGLYLNVATDKYPNGYLRGQVQRLPGLAYKAMLDASQEVVPDTSQGVGIGLMWLVPTLDTLNVNMLMSGLSSPMSRPALHVGIPDSVGPYLSDLSYKIAGNRVVGQLVQAGGLSPALITQLIAGNIYVDIHTERFPEGEIRGEAYPMARDGFVIGLCGEQETPPVTTSGSGTMVVSVDHQMERAHYMISADGLSGVVTGAHFHREAPGVPGAIVKDLSAILSGGSARGYWTSTDATQPLTSDLARAMKNDSMYFNIHTGQHTGGEIRGQISDTVGCQTVTTASIPAEADMADAQIQPNPVTGNMTVRLSFAERHQATIRIVDISGTIRELRDMPVEPGTTTSTFDMTGLASGVYFVQIIRDGKTEIVERIVKEQ